MAQGQAVLGAVGFDGFELALDGTVLVPSAAIAQVGINDGSWGKDGGGNWYSGIYNIQAGDRTVQEKDAQSYPEFFNQSGISPRSSSSQSSGNESTICSEIHLSCLAAC